MKPEGLHITVLDWVAPLFDYEGTDKRVPRLAPLAMDFILLGKRLERLGFVFNAGRIIPTEV